MNENMYEIFHRDNRYFVRRFDTPGQQEWEITLPALCDLSGHLLRYQEDFINENKSTT